MDEHQVKIADKFIREFTCMGMAGSLLLEKLKHAKERADLEGWISADNLEKEMELFGIKSTSEESEHFWE